MDKSTHPTVIEYAAHEMMKKKSPAAAARATAKRLNGSENMFLGPGIVEIDPRTLEDALWGRLIEFVETGVTKVKPGFEHFALDGTIVHFQQKLGIRAELKRRVIAHCGADPFVNDK